MCVEAFLIVALLSAISPRTVLCQGDSRASRANDLQPRFASFETAPTGRFPYMCSLRFNADRSKHACGGILIHPSWILTAAHCVDPTAAGSTGLVPIVYCGIHDIEDNSDDLVFATVEGIMHEDWDRGFYKGNDIAMLKLDREALVTLPRLNVPNSRPEPGRPLDGLGWGETSGGKEATKLQLAENLIAVSNSMCNERWDGKLNEERVLCAGIGENDACKGDSGGPLLHADSPDGSVKNGSPRLDLIVGIVSFGDGPCGRSTEPGVYTDVGYYREWIQSVIGGTDQCNGTGKAGDGPMAPAVSPQGDDSAPPSDPEIDLEDDFDSPLDTMSNASDTEPSGGRTPCSPISVASPEPGPCTNPPELKDVVAAIKHDDAAAVQTALDCGLDPDSGYSETFAWADRSLLHWAVRYDSPDSAKALIESGADVKGKNSRNTHLHYCSYLGSVSVAKVLISSGADVNAKGIGEDSPLHDAASNGHADVAKLLLDSGADVDARDDDGETPLHAAATEDHPEIIRILVDAGANIDAKDDDSETPLHEASKEGNNRVVEELIEEGADMEAKEKDGHTALHLAAIRDHADTAKILVDAGADVDATDYSGETPLHEAAERGHLVVVRVLVDAGGSKTIRDLSRNRPVDVVCDPAFSQCSRNTRLVIKDLLAP